MKKLLCVLACIFILVGCKGDFKDYSGTYVGTAHVWTLTKVKDNKYEAQRSTLNPNSRVFKEILTIDDIGVFSSEIGGQGRITDNTLTTPNNLVLQKTK